MAETIVTNPATMPPISLDTLDLGKVVLSYDRESDTLMIHLHGRGQPGVSRHVTDEFMIRLGRDRQTVLDFQIEHFLSRVVHEHPKLLDVLDIAELRGITIEEVARLRRDVASTQKRETIAEVIAEFSPFDPAAD